MKQIILCADDYGQNPTISQAIINLIEKNCLSATSCMTNRESWPEWSRCLVPFKDKIDIGLHVNFTEGKPLSLEFKQHYGNQLFSLPQLLILAHLRILNKKVLIAEIQAQLDQFIEYLGYLPDFIDGHQHVHHFPVIRDALIEVYHQRRLQQANSYVRCVYEEKAWIPLGKSGYIKRLLIQLTGAKQFKRQLVKYGIPHNLSFSGSYPFSQAKQFPNKFAHFLKQIKQGGLIMCHPGLPENSVDDPLHTSRGIEYQYLATELLPQLLASGCKLHRFKEIAN